jgi:YidC/Oxa1 family membrane protein insertase
LKALGLAFNVSGQAEPVLWPGRFTRVGADQSPTTIAFHQQAPGGVEITRTYAISATEKEGDPYVITHTTTIANHGEKSVPLHLLINAGTAPPTPGAGTIAAAYLNFGFYNGASFDYVPTTTFLGSPGALFGLFGATPPKPLVWVTRPSPDLQWVSVKNEFFAAVLTPHAPLRGSGYFAKGVKLEVDGKPETGVTGDMEMNLGLLVPGAEKKFSLDYYVGPKEYVRLDRLGDQQDLVMQFGWTGWLSKLLLLCLIGIHSAIQHISPAWAWGWSIVTITIFIKLLTYPLTAIQVKSAKRMSQIQKPLAEIKERYKDNPQKLQTEMMELFKKNKVNPAAGCLPMFIQLPVFLSFYSMLRTASEMRFAGFLWMHDLSAADTVAHLGSFPINILPVLMTLTTFVQMRMTPSPTTDSVQKQMFQIMPFMMLFFFYTMPSGMILYWICSNLCTIVQQFITNRSKDDPATVALDPARARAGAMRSAKRR